MIHIRKITDPQDLKTWYAIREATFFKELGIPPSYEDDPYQKEAHFFLAKVDNQPAGNGRYRLKKGLIKFEWIATLPTFRRQGIGKKIVKRMLDNALQNNPTYLPVMHARTAVLPFYEEMGWHPVGDIFHDANMDQQVMIFLPQI